MKRTTPNPVQPSNILLQQFPPPIEEDTVGAIAGSLATYSYATMAALGVVWFFTAFRAGVWAFLFRSTLLGVIAVGIYAANGIVGRKIEKELDRVRLNMLKQRADKVGGSPH